MHVSRLNTFTFFRTATVRDAMTKDIKAKQRFKIQMPTTIAPLAGSCEIHPGHPRDLAESLGC